MALCAAVMLSQPRNAWPVGAEPPGAEGPRTLTLAMVAGTAREGGVDATGAPVAFGSVLGEAVARVMGRPFVLRMATDWKSASEWLRKGTVDFLLHPGYVTARTERFDFTDPFLVLPNALYVPRERYDIGSLEHLVERKVACLKGNHSHRVRMESLGARCVEVADPRAALAALREGAVDAFVYPEPIVAEVLRRDPGADWLKSVGLTRQQMYWDFAVRRENQPLRMALDEALAVLRQEGELQRLRQAYFEMRPESHESKYEDALIFVSALAMGLVVALGGFLYFDATRLREQREYLRQSLIQWRRAERGLREQQTLLLALVDAIPHRLFVKDIEGRYRLVNRHMAEAHRMPADLHVGKTAEELDFLPRSVREAWQEQDRLTLLQGEKKEFPDCVYDFGQGARYFHVIKVPWRAGDGRILGLVGMAVDTTESREDARRIAEQHNLLRALFETIPHRVAVKDRDRRYVMVNRRLSRHSGDAPSAFIGKRLEELPNVAPELVKLAREQDQRVLDFGERVEMAERRHDFGDGERIHHIIKLPLLDKDGQVNGIVGITEDVTERKRNEEALWESRNLLRALFDTVPHWLTLTGLDGRFRMVNAAFARDVGMTPAEILGQSWQAVTGRESPLQELFRQLPPPVETIDARTEFTDLRYGDSDGRARYRHLIRLPYHNRDGKVAGVVSLSMDITEQKTAEGEVREARNLLQVLVDSVPERLFLKDRAGRYRLVNRAFVRDVGMPAEEIVGRTSAELSALPVAIRQQWMQDDRQVYTTGTPLEIEQRHEVLHGPEGRITHLVKLPLLGADGQVDGLVGMVEDITERVRAEEERAHLYTVFERAAESMVVTDIRGRIVLVNPAFERMSGYARAEVIGETHRLVTSGMHDAAFYQELWDTILAGQTWEGEFENRRKDGSLYHVRSVIAPVIDVRGEISNFIAVSRETTHERLMEERLIQAQKLDALGTLVAGVAHEINNPSSVIMLNSEVLSEMWGAIAEVLASVRKQQGDFRVGPLGVDYMLDNVPLLLEGIHDGSERIKGIVSNLKDYARMDPADTDEVIDLNQVVQSTATILAGEIRKATDRFSLELADSLPRCRGSFQRMQQVLINVVLNACQALPSRHARLRVRTYVEPERRMVVVTVEDQGGGIAPEALKQVKDPFFTTKREMGGTGLGLSISDGIVRAHGGQLTLASTAGVGTVVTVRLPQAFPERGAA